MFSVGFDRGALTEHDMPTLMRQKVNKVSKGMVMTAPGGADAHQKNATQQEQENLEVLAALMHGGKLKQKWAASNRPPRGMYARYFDNIQVRLRG